MLSANKRRCGVCKNKKSPVAEKQNAALCYSAGIIHSNRSDINVMDHIQTESSPSDSLRGFDQAS